MSAADLILGTPWRPHGDEPGRGMDCYGAVRWLGAKWATPLPDLRAAMRHLWDFRTEFDMLELLPLPAGWSRVSLAEARRGDVVWMHHGPAREGPVDHIEIVETSGQSVSSFRGYGVRRMLWNVDWRARVAEVWRPR